MQLLLLRLYLRIVAGIALTMHDSDAAATMRSRVKQDGKSWLWGRAGSGLFAQSEALSKFNDVTEPDGARIRPHGS